MRYLLFSFSWELRDEKIHLCKLEFWNSLDNKKIIKYCFIACYTQNIHGWFKFLALLHVTTWIWIEIERQLISITDNWCNECYCMDLERN
jgi:hypothetical protein